MPPKNKKDSEKEVKKTSIGKLFSKARKEKKLSIEEAVKETNIRAIYLKAMEEDNFDALPGGIYTTGYLKSYAKFLKIDESELPENIDDNKNNTAEETVLVAEPYQAHFSPTPLVITASVVALILIYLVWLALEDGTEVTNAKEESLISYYTAPEHTVTLVASGTAQLTVLNKEQETLFDKLVNIGDTYFLPDEEGIIMRTDNFNVIEIYVNGEQVISMDNLEKKAGGVILDLNKLLANVVLD